MKILLATDGSAGAKNGAMFLRELGLGPGDEILLLAVAQKSPETAFGEAQGLLDPCRAAIRRVEAAGSPPVQIVEAAARENSDLIVLGAQGESGHHHFFMGGVAEKVVRHAGCSILVARAVRYDLRRALLAIDGSDVAARVVSAAAGLPLPERCELRMITVLPAREMVLGVAPLVWASLSSELETVLQAAVQTAEERIRRLAQVLRERGRPVSAEILRGDAATMLLNAAKKEQADLIVLGSHGEGGMERYLLGSVSERVARHADCSVLVVR